jgi:hypothetical protein
MSVPLPKLALAVLLTGVVASAGAAAARESEALFVHAAPAGANTFSTDDCFAGNDTGALSPSAETADTGGDGDGFEVSASNAFADGGGYAENIDGAGDRHRYYNYGVPVASGCAIEGIVVRLDAWKAIGGSDATLSVELSWDGGTSWTSPQATSDLGTTEATFTLGGAADTWGRTWSAGELSNANFRVRITSASTDAGQDFELDWAPVTVHYGP